eukprot:TCONS_00039461-protein
MILHWNKRKIEAQAEYLVKKYKKVQGDLLQHEKDVKTALDKFDVQPDFADLKSEIRAIASKVSVPSATSLTDSAKILLLFHDLKRQVNDHEEFSFLASICPNLPDLSVLNIQLLRKKKEDKIKILRSLIKSNGQNIDPNDVLSVVTVGFERMMESVYFEKVHWLTRIKKVADTSKQRFILRKKVSKTTTSMQNLVTLYNEFSREKVVFDDVIKGSFKWILDLQQRLYPRGFTDIEKRCVLISQMKKERCEEELVILQLEMKKYLRFYGNKCLTMEQEIKIIWKVQRFSANCSLSEKDTYTLSICCARRCLCFKEFFRIQMSNMMKKTILKRKTRMKMLWKSSNRFSIMISMTMVLTLKMTKMKLEMKSILTLIWFYPLEMTS